MLVLAGFVFSLYIHDFPFWVLGSLTICRSLVRGPEPLRKRSGSLRNRSAGPRLALLGSLAAPYALHLCQGRAGGSFAGRGWNRSWPCGYVGCFGSLVMEYSEHSKVLGSFECSIGAGRPLSAG